MEINLNNLVKLSDVVEIVLGQTFRAKAESSEPTSGVKVMQIKDISNTSIVDIVKLPFANLQSHKIKMHVNRGDLLIPLRGSRYEVALYDVKNSSFPVTITNQIAALRSINEKVDIKYLFWFLNSKIGRDKINHISKGSAISQINRRDLESLELPLPSLDEQSHIISVYSKWLEQKVTLNEILKNGDKLTEKYCYSLALGSLNNE